MAPGITQAGRESTTDCRAMDDNPRSCRSEQSRCTAGRRSRRPSRDGTRALVTGPLTGQGWTRLRQTVSIRCVLGWPNSTQRPTLDIPAPTRLSSNEGHLTESSVTPGALETHTSTQLCALRDALDGAARIIETLNSAAMELVTAFGVSGAVSPIVLDRLAKLGELANSETPPEPDWFHDGPLEAAREAHRVLSEIVRSVHCPTRRPDAGFQADRSRPLPQDTPRAIRQSAQRAQKARRCIPS